MYVLIAGGGKVGSNLARTLIRGGHEVTLIEQRGNRFDQLEVELEHQVHKGDATELFTLERAGIERPPDIVVAVTGDDEDNVVICQLARDRFGVENVIARVNDPRNQPYFDLLGIAPTVSATAAIMGLIEHEVPEHGLIHLLELKKENLEIVEITIGEKDACAGKASGQVALPEGSRVISVVRDGKAEPPDASLTLEPGDSVLAILAPGKEEELRRVLVRE
jgi:trk system potassium uptake protein